MKLTEQHTAFLSTISLEVEKAFLSYRLGMRVTEVRVFNSPVYGKTGYYICPRCKTTMEREFVSFCDRCGQHLDWEDYWQAKVIYPGRRKNEA